MKEKITVNLKLNSHSIDVEKNLANEHKSLFLINRYKAIIEREKNKEESFHIRLDSYFYAKNTIKIKNSEIVKFLKSYGISGWHQHPTALSKWIHLSDELIATKLEGILYCFCKKYRLCTDKKQLSHVIYFFEQLFVRTLAKKYQTSVKKIYTSRLISKKGYLLLYCDNDQNYYKIFRKKSFYQCFVI